MALWEFTNLNKHGNYRTRIIHIKGALSIPGSGLGPVVFANRFKYKYTHKIYPPNLITLNSKTYIVPSWQEVLPETELSDIEWIKPKSKVVAKQEPITETHSSSSSDKTYKTSYYLESGKYHCNCMGRFRARDGRCKHIKALEKKVKVS
jgi:hypothetical protein